MGADGDAMMDSAAEAGENLDDDSDVVLDFGGADDHSDAGTSVLISISPRRSLYALTFCFLFFDNAVADLLVVTCQKCDNPQ